MDWIRNVSKWCPTSRLKDLGPPGRFTPPYLLIKKHEDLHNSLWDGHYMTYQNEIVGLVAPKNELYQLNAVKAWLDKEHIVLRAYVAGISSRSFCSAQRRSSARTSSRFLMQAAKSLI